MSAQRGARTRSQTRDVVSYVFSFFLSIVLLGMTVLVVARVGVFSSRGIASAMDSTFYESVLDYVNKEASYYTLPTGVDPAVLDDVFVVEEVKSDVDESVSAMLADVSFAPTGGGARDRLLQNVEATFAQDGVEVAHGDATEDIATSYVDDVMDVYAESISIPGLDAMGQVNAVFTAYFPLALAGLVAFAGLLVFLIVRLHHFVHRSLRYVAYAFGAAALMSLVAPLALYTSGFYRGLSVEPQYFYHLCVSLISHVLRCFMYGSAALLVLSVVTAVLSSRLRKRALRHKSMRHAL